MNLIRLHLLFLVKIRLNEMIVMKIMSISMEKREWNSEPDVSALERAASLRGSDAEVAYTELAEKGSVLSMANLGNYYEYRRISDGGPDYMRAEFWYRKAIDSDSAVVTLHFGYFYLRRKEIFKAMAVFSLGVERGYAPSIVRLADFYVKGIGVARDYACARALLKQASDLGNLWAKRGLARMDFNIGKDPATRLRGLVMRLTADAQFYLEKKRNPSSERLKK